MKYERKCHRAWARRDARCMSGNRGEKQKQGLTGASNIQSLRGSLIRTLMPPAIAASLMLTTMSGAYAQQITADGKTDTNIIVNGNITDITTSTVRGQNAFNSFSYLTIDTGNVANFYLPNDTTNLLNVISHSVSINGMVNSIKDSAIGGNMYFVTPGFVVGQSGVLNVGSLKVVTPSQDYINDFFVSGNPSDMATVQVLNGQVPLDSNGYITVQGKINAIGDISLKGGNVTVTNSGVITTGAVFSTPPDMGDVVNLNGLENGNKIAIVNGDIVIEAVNDVETSGAIATYGAADLDAGDIRIAAGNNVTLSNGSRLLARGDGENSDGGNIQVSAGNNLSSSDGTAYDAGGGAVSGNAGTIKLSADNSVTLGGTFRETAANGTAGSALIEAAHVEIAANVYQNGGNLTIASGGGITVNSNVVVSTRQTVNGATDNQLTAASTGSSGEMAFAATGYITVSAGAQFLTQAINQGATTYHAGDITLTGQNITLGAGAQLLATVTNNGATTGTGAGDITLTAAQAQIRDDAAARASANIHVNGAMLSGNNITLTAAATAAYSWDWLKTLVTDTAQHVLDKTDEYLTGVDIQTAISEGSSGVTIGSGSHLNATNNVNLSSTSNSSVKLLDLVSPGSLSGEVFSLGIVYGETEAVAKTEIQSDATIDCRDLTVTATNNATLSVNNFSFSQGDSIDVAVSITNANVNAQALIGSGATITANHSVSVSAVNNSEFSTAATAMALGQGKAGIAAVIFDAATHATALVGTNLTTSGLQNVTVAAYDNTTKNKASASGVAGSGFMVRKFVNPLINPAGLKLVENALNPLSILDSRSGATATEKAKLAAVVTWVTTEGTATALVAADKVVNAAGDVVIAAKVSDAHLQNLAQSATESQAKKEATEDNPSGNITLSAALAYGDYTHAANAKLGANAQVTAQRVGIASQVDIPYEITYLKWNGISSLADKVNGNLGLANGFLTGFANAQSNASDLGVAGSVAWLDFHNTSKAAVDQGARITILPGAVAPVPNTTLPGWELNWAAPVVVFADTRSDGVFAAGNISLLLNGTGGESGGESMGGSYNQTRFNNTTEAYVAQGAVIAPQSGGSPVDMIVRANSAAYIFAISPSAGRGASFGLNGTFSFNQMNNRTEASVSNEAHITANTLTVTAADNPEVWSISGAFTMTDSGSVGLGVGINEITTNTNAFIGNNNAISGSNLTLTPGSVTANNLVVDARTVGTVDTIAVAGSRVKSEAEEVEEGQEGAQKNDRKAADNALEEGISKIAAAMGADESANKPKFGIGISGSAAINVTDINTAAYIDAATLTLAGGGRAVNITAVNNTEIVAAGGSAALITANSPTSTMNGGIAGSFALNDLANDTTAYITNSTVGGTQNIAVNALTGGEQLAIALGANVNNSDSQTKSAGLAGSVSMNTTKNTVDAHIDNGTTLTASQNTDSNLSIIAYDQTKLGTGGGSLLSGGRGSLGAAVTYTVTHNTTEASLSQATVSNFANVAVQGWDATQIAAGGGMIGVTKTSGSVALGGAFVISEIANTTDAAIEADSSVTGSQAVNVTAADTSGIAQYNQLIQYDGKPDSSNYDYSGAEAGAASPTASSIISVAGLIQSTNGNNVGISYTQNTINNRYLATISESTVSATGTVTVNASSGATITGLSVGVGKAADFAGGGAVTNNSINNKVTAQVSSITGKTITAGTLTVQADDKAKIDSLAGQVTVSTGNAAFGAAIANNYIGDTAHATIAGVNAAVAQKTSVQATNHSGIRTLAATAGGSSEFAVNGSAAASQINNTTEADITNASADAVTGAVDVTALDTATIRSLAGSLTLAGSGAVGAAVSVNRIGNTTSAHVSGRINSGFNIKDLTITGQSRSTVESGAIGAGIGVNIGVAGSTATNYINSDTKAYIDGGTVVTAQNNVGVIARADDVITNLAGAAGIGLAAGGFGASVTVNEISGDTDAYISGADTQISALAQNAGDALTVSDGTLTGSIILDNGLSTGFIRPDLEAMRHTTQVTGVAVNASATHSVANIVANVAGGTYAGVAGTTNVSLIAGNTKAYIDSASINSSGTGSGNQNLSVIAGDYAYSHGFVGTIATGWAGVGMGADTNIFKNSTEAYIKNSAAVNAQGGITVDAASGQGASSLAASGSMGVGAIVGTASVGIFDSTTKAYIKSDTLNTGSLAINVVHNSNFSIAAGGVTVGGLAAAGSFAVVSDDSTNEAYVDNSTVNTNGTISVTADNIVNINNWSVSGAGGGAAGIAGSVAVSLVNDTTAAYVVGGSQLGSSGSKAASALVKAVDTVNVTNRAGALGIGIAGWGVGAGASVVELGNTTSAYVADSDVYTTGVMNINAEAQRTLTNTAVTVGIGLTTGISGSAAVTLVGKALSGSVNSSELDQDDQGTLTQVDNLTNRNRLSDQNVNTGLTGVTSGITTAEMNQVNNAGKFSTDSQIHSAALTYRTAALISGDSEIHAGSIGIAATEKDDNRILAGGLAAGSVGIGGSVGVMEVNRNVQAGALSASGGTPQLIATGAIGIAATTADRTGNPSLSVASYQGSAGIVGLGAAVSVADLTGNVTAGVDRGVKLQSGSDGIAIEAEDNSSVSAAAAGFASGFAVAGIVTANASKDGTISATIGDTESTTSVTTSVNSGSGGLAVESSRSGQVSATALAGAGGVVSGNGAAAIATEDGAVNAIIGNQVNLTAAEAVKVAAIAAPQTHAEQRGYGGALIAQVGIGFASATATPEVTAFIGAKSDIAAGSLTVNAVTRLDNGNDSAYSYAEAVGVGGFLNVGVNQSKAETQSTVTAGIGDDTRLTTGSTTVAASNITKEKGEVSGVSASVLAAAGSFKADANANSITNATVGDGVYGNAGTALNVLATGVDTTFAKATAGSGGLRAGAAAEATTHNGSATTATLGGGTSTQKLFAENMTVLGQHEANINSQTDSIKASILGASGSISNNYTYAAGSNRATGTVVTAQIAPDANLETQNIVGKAINTTVKENLSGDNAYAGSGGLIDSAAAVSETEVYNYTCFLIGEGAAIMVTGDTDNPLLTNFDAINEINLYDRSRLDSGGAIAIAKAESLLDANLHAEVTVGANVAIDSVGPVNLGTRNKAHLNANASSKTYGLAGAAQGNSNATVNAFDKVTIGSGVNIRADGDISLMAGHDSGGVSNNLTSVAYTDLYNKTALPIETDPDADATVKQDNTIAIETGAGIGSVANVNLLTDKGIASASGQGIGKDLYRELLAEIGSAFSNLFGGGDVSLDIHGGSSANTASSSVRADGSVHAGIQHIQYLNIVEAGAAPTSSLAIQPDQLAETITIQVGSAADPDHPDDPNYTIPIYKTYTVYRTSGVTYDVGTENLQTNLVTRITALQQLLGQYSGNANTQAALTAEIDFLQQKLAEMFPEGSAQSATIAQVNDVPLITVHDVLARSGNINVVADSLTGSGTLDAPGDVKIDIINGGQAYLKTRRLTIPEDSGGYIYFNGASISQGSDITSRNASGSFAGVVTAADSSPVPAITVLNTYVPSGNDALAPDIGVSGDIRNLRGIVTISSASGSVNIESADPAQPLTAPSIAAGTIHITAGKDFVYNSPNSWYNVGGDPRSIWGGLRDSDGNAVPGVNDDKTADNYEDNYEEYALDASTSGTPESRENSVAVGRNGSGSAIAGNNIFISARYLNINGLIQSGIQDFEITIPNATALTNEIQGYQADYNAKVAAGNPPAVLTYQLRNTSGNITAFYNAKTGEIELQPVRSQGGTIQLIGEILNTGGGSIKTMDGYSKITVTNDSNYNVVEQGLDTGGAGINGKIIITDFAQQYTAANSAGQTVTVPVTTTYTRENGTIHVERTATVYNPDGTATQYVVRADQDTGSARGGDDEVNYAPAEGERFMWVTGSTIGTSDKWVVNHTTGGWGFEWSDDDEYSGTHTQISSGTHPIPSNGYEMFTPSAAQRAAWGSQSDAYEYTGTYVNTGVHEWDVYDSWSSGFLGYYKHHERTHYRITGGQIYNLNSVKGDYAIPIQFIGYDQGTVNISSDAGIVLAGGINNASGSVTLNANQAITSASSQVVITSRQIDLSAGTGIGNGDGNVPVYFNLTGNPGSVTALSTCGDINLQSIQGLVNVNRIAAGNGGNVSLVADGSIVQAAAGSDAVITGHIINLVSTTGVIGTASQSLNVQVVPSSGADLTAGLSAAAAGDIYLRQPENDFPLISLTSYNGDVTIEAVNGSLVNANPNEEPDARNQEQLLALWENNQLLAGEGAETSAANTLAAYQNMMAQLYQEYWRNARHLRIESDGSSSGMTYGADAYDANYRVPLSETFAARLKVLKGWTDADLQAFQQQLTEAFGSGAYDPSYVYQIPSTGSHVIILSDLTTGYSWNENQLQTGITALYFKQTSDTQTVIPEPNVTALNGNVTLKALHGSVGTDTAPVVISGDDLRNPTEQQRLALAAAEAIDIVEDNNPANPSITVLQRRAINVNTSGVINIEAQDHVYLGSQTDLRIQAAVAGESIRIKGQGSIFDVSIGGQAALQGGGTQGVILEAAEGSIGTSSKPLTMVLNPGTPLTARAGQGIYINELTGDLNVAYMYTPLFVNLTAAGSILNGAAPASVVTIQGNGVNLTATNGSIGAVGNLLKVAVGPDADAGLSAFAGGGIYLASPDRVGSTSFSHLNLYQMKAGGIIVIDAENEVVEDPDGSIEALGLMVNSVGGQTLNGVNSINSFQATNSGSGDIELTNTANLLTITGLSQTAGGNVAVNNTGVIDITGAVDTSGNVDLTASQAITESGDGRIVNAALLTTQSSGGQTLTGANTAHIFNATNGDGGVIQLTNIANSLVITGIGQTAGGNVLISNTGNLDINGAVDTTGNVDLTASEAITESGDGRIVNAAILATQSSGSQTLNGANTAHIYNAINNGGDIQLFNTVNSLTITGISQTAGGNVVVSNTGNIDISGAVDTTGNVDLVASEAITESGDGRIVNAAISATQSSGGQTLTGANTAHIYNAINNGGDIQLFNTVNSLTITGISQTVGGNVLISNTGNLDINGAVDTTGNVDLTASEAITESGDGRIVNAAILATQSSGGQTLNGINSINSFQATNSGSGDIELSNTANLLTITGISQTAGGNIVVDNNTGNVTISGVVDTTGNVDLTASQTIIESGSGRIVNAALLTTQSSGGQTLNGANTVASLNATNGGGGNIEFINTANSLVITSIIQMADGNVIADNTGNIIITGVVETTGNVDLTASQTIIESGSGRIVNAALLTTQSSGGQTLNGANTAHVFHATNGGGDVQLINTANSLAITGISQTAGGDVAVNNTGNIDISGAVDTTGNVDLTASQVIIESGSGRIVNATLLTTQSNDGQTLNGVNSVASFNATNGGGEDIQLINTANSLVITGSSQTAGGNVVVSNTGNIDISGAVDTTGNVDLTASEAITESGDGRIVNAAILATQSSGGQTLNGANTAHIYNAINNGGDIQLTNIATSLTITGISQTAGGDVVVSNTGNIDISGAVDTTGNVDLTASQMIIESGSGRIVNVALLTTQSSGGQTLNGANTVASFNATNGDGGDVKLINTANWLGITGISQTAGGDVAVSNTGNITITDTVDTTGNVDLTASEAITESGDGRIGNAALLTTQSSGGQTLNGVNTVHSLNMANSGSGAIEFINTAGPLTITGISQNTGDVMVTNTGDLTITGVIITAANGDITLTAMAGNETIGAAVIAGGNGMITLDANGMTSDIVINAAVKSTDGDIAATAGRDITLSDQIATNGNVSLAAGGSITEITDGKVLNAVLLTTSSNGGQTLTGANTVASYNATNGGGDVQLNNTASMLGITGISQTADGDVAVSNTGNITITGAVDTTDNVDLTASQRIIESGSGRIVNAALLTAQSNDGQTLTGANSVASFNATNGDGGDVELINTANGLGITGINQTAGGNVTVDNTGNITITGVVNTTGNVYLTALQAIAESGDGRIINTARLTTTSSGGQTLNGANTAHIFDATNGGGDIQLNNNASTLAITGLSQTAGGNVTVNNTGNIDISGAVDTTGNVDLTASQVIIESGSGRIVNAALLTTQSSGGQTLNGANTAHVFNATNGDGGAVQLNNTISTLGITGINQTAGGNVAVGNTGNIAITAVVDTIGNVDLTASQAITESGGGQVINAALLTTQSSGGQTLKGANTVASFNATNGGGGDVQLNNTISTLGITGIIQTAGGNVAVGNTGNIAITGVVDTIGNVDLTASQAITESGGGQVINAALLTTQSSGGQTLKGANTVASFNATNGGGGDVELINTAGPLTIEEIRQTAGGNVTVDNKGDIHVKTVSATTGDVELTAENGSILNRLENSDVNLKSVDIRLTAETGQIGESTARLVVDSAGKVNAEARGDIYLEERNGDLVSDTMTSQTGLIDLLVPDGGISVATISAPWLSFNLLMVGASLNLGDISVATSISASADNVQFRNLIHTGQTPLQVSIRGGSQDMAEHVAVNATSEIGIVFGKLHANRAEIKAETNILDFYHTLIRDRAEFRNHSHSALAENHYHGLEDFTVQLYPENKEFFLFFDSDRMIYTSAFIVNYDPDFILNHPDIRNSFVREAEQNLPVASSMPEILTTGNLLTLASLSGGEPQNFVVYAPDNLGIENDNPGSNDQETNTP